MILQHGSQQFPMYSYPCWPQQDKYRMHKETGCLLLAATLTKPNMDIVNGRNVDFEDE